MVYYKNTDILCPLCEKYDDSQEHLFECEKIKEFCCAEVEFRMEDLFTDDTERLYSATKTLIEMVKVRDSIINPDE